MSVTCSEDPVESRAQTRASARLAPRPLTSQTDSRILTEKDVAEQILQTSPSIALRISHGTGGAGKWEVVFVTKNIAAYGYTRGDFLSGRIGWMDVVHPEDREDLRKYAEDFANMGAPSVTVVYRIARKDGTARWVHDTMTFVRDTSGRVLHHDSVVFDYTETQENLERLRTSLRQQAALNRILQGMHVPDLGKALGIILGQTGAFLGMGRITLFRNTGDGSECTALHEWCAKGVPSLLERDERRIDYRRDIPEIADSLDRAGYRVVDPGACPAGCAAFVAGSGAFSVAAFEVALPEGQEHESKTSGRKGREKKEESARLQLGRGGRLRGKPFGFLYFEDCLHGRHWNNDNVLFLENVARLVAPAILRHRHEERIHALAMTDQLTGLNNRHSLDKQLDEALQRAGRTNRSGYVLFIDLDDFKNINDAYGHDYGDATLKEISRFLREYFVNPKNIFRLGGDEFVVILEPGTFGPVYSVMGGLLDRARLPWRVLEKNLHCTLSIGVVQYPNDCAKGSDIVKDADTAMYQAKKMGKNNCVFYHTLDEDALAYAAMETALREDVADGFRNFSVRYQPLTDMDTNIIGAEALLRWDMNGRDVPPDRFIPLAEHLGNIVPLGEHVLRSAADLCRRINAFMPDFFVSVNVSVRQFKQQEFMESLLRILGEAGVKPGNIALEITEGMAVHNMRHMKMLGEEIRKRGMRIAMDDFGTGYSSLGNMRELPIDLVKIDRSFIRDVTTDAYSESFVRLISTLVHSMGRKVCIEGVETEAQYKFCRECGADCVQGFHLWRPMPEDQLLRVLGGEKKATPDE